MALVSQNVILNQRLDPGAGLGIQFVTQTTLRGEN